MQPGAAPSRVDGTTTDPPSLAALLDVGTHEVLGVLLEHVVDLVEQIVGVLSELLATFLTGTAVADRGLVVVSAASALWSAPAP